MKNAIAVILAGGAGKRFWPLTINKALFPFAGVPLVVRSLEHLVAAGFTHAVLVINPRDVAFYMDLNVPGLEFHTVIQQQALGMGDALMRVREHVGGSPMLVVSAHDVVDPSFFKTLALRISGSPEISFLTGKRLETYFDGGHLKIDGDRVTGIVEKPGADAKPSNLISLVFDYISDSETFFTILSSAQSDRDDVFEQALDAFIKKFNVKYASYEGVWQPMKYPWHALDLCGYFLKEEIAEHRGKNLAIAKSAVIEGKVHIEDNVRIFENTKIVGPVFIGQGTIIGNNNIIRHSHIGRRCVTGFNTDITRSYIGENSWFHSNYIGDSVLEGNVSMGSGTVLANLRLDEGDIWSVVDDQRVNTGRTKLGAIIGRDVRIGVNASIMPGVKIGSGSFVGSGVVLDKDLTEGKFCVCESAYAMTDNTHTASTTRDEFRNKLS